MSELILKRFVGGVVVVWLAMSLIFVLASTLGDPCIADLGPNASHEALQQCRHVNGYDRPKSEQYARYFGRIFSGDFGTRRDGQPVLRVIGTRLPRTLLLSGMALSFEIAFGLLIGIIAALRRGTLLDTGVMGLAFLGISLPTFVTGPLFLLVFAFGMGWFPIGGYGVGFLDHVYHGLLPAFVMAIIGAATYARVMRSEMIETMQADYIRTARAKGLHPVQVVFGHGVRNAMLPIVQLIGLSFPFLVSGALISEYIFNWPGMGMLAIESITTRDRPMILGVMLIAAIFVQIGNLLADIASGFLDPRIRLGKR